MEQDNSTDSKIAHLIQASHSQLSATQAATWLQDHQGDVQRALNAYFDSQLVAAPRPSASPAPASSAPASSVRSAKKQKTDSGQRSITAFFTSPTKQTVAKQPGTVQQQQTHLAATTQHVADTPPSPPPTATPPQQQPPLPAPPPTQPSNPTDFPKDAVMLPLDQFRPMDHSWRHGPTPYLHLARALAGIDATTKRLAIGDALVNTFRAILAVSPEDLVPAAYLMMGAVGPRHEAMQLGVGGR